VRIGRPALDRVFHIGLDAMGHFSLSSSQMHLVGCELVDEPAKRPPSAVIMEGGGEAARTSNVSYSARFERYRKEEEDQMFGKAKGSSREKDEPLPPAPQLQDLTPANLAESNSTDISYIGPGMTVVGKISSEGTLNVFGRVEGELHASIVRISNGARVEGAIAAQDLTIGGRFKGTIPANRVTLTSSAVVEGEIHHRSLAIEENAWFAGVSRPEEASASEATDSRSSVQLMPTDGSRQINGSLETEFHAHTATG
jgi:cytoskeletal protein CcmA (bactofilin family)